MSTFQELSLQPATLAVLKSMKITEPTAVQAEAIPALLAGRDLVGQSATGSGKTLAYGVPLVERLARERVAQALVLVPTRELAMQVNAVLSKFAVNRKLTTALLVGGRAYGPQISALRYGAQIIVGTPGRVKDHLDRGTLTLNKLRICVLDEADQMLDSGFAPDIEEILTNSPETRQMALFSATMPGWVTKLQEKLLKDPVRVEIGTQAGAESTIEQIAYQVAQDKKIATLCTLLNATEGGSSLVFGRTKYGVEKLGKQLDKLGFTVGTLHGDKSQRAREEVLTAFRRGQVQTLLATNVAARGLDIQGIEQVINYELPESSELFTHRVGRTGRMGRQGKAITLLAPSEVGKWRRMTKSLGQEVELQKLAIDESVLTTPVAERPVATVHMDDEPVQAQERRALKPVSGMADHVQDGYRRERRVKQPTEFEPKQRGVQVKSGRTPSSNGKMVSIERGYERRGRSGSEAERRGRSSRGSDRRNADISVEGSNATGRPFRRARSVSGRRGNDTKRYAYR
jgi:ATP-dependent RNA helicase DeaD